MLVQGLLIMLSTVWTQRVNNGAVGTEIVGVAGLTVLLLIVGAARTLLHWGHVVSTGAIPHAGYFNFGTGSVDGPWILGFLLGAFTIVGFEAAGNLAEETQQPDKVVPRAMWTSVALSGVLGFAFLIAITAASGNLKALAASSTPVADVVIRVLGSAVGKIFLVFVLYSIFACGLVIFVTATRVCWAMSRDQRFPGWQALQKVDRKTDSPALAVLTVGVLIEVVLAIFATQTNALFNLFSAATIMPAVIYLVTVILYVLARKRLPATHGFSLRRWEIPVVVISLVWLAFEMSIFRASSFGTSWAYAGVMTAIGLLYFVYLVVSRRSLAMPGTAGTTPASGGSPAPPVSGAPMPDDR